MRRPDGVEDRAGHAVGGRLERLRGGQEAGPVARRPLPLPALEEAELLGEGVGVEGGLDLEDLHARCGDQPAHAPVRRVQLGAVLVHERAALGHGAGVVVVAQAAVAGQAGGHRLVAAVHGHQVDVDVDEQVRGGRPLVDLDVLALVGEAEVDQLVGVLGVVLLQQPVGGEGVVDAVTQGVAQLGVGHAAVQRQRRDEHHVVHAGLGGQLEDLLDHQLAHVGAAHGRQRQRDVVEGDGELHARPQQGRAAGRRRQGGCRGRGGWRRRGRLRASTGSGAYSTRLPVGQPLEPEPLAVPEQAWAAWSGRPRGRSRASGSCVRSFRAWRPRWSAGARRTPRRSKTTFTAPRRPAAPAWASASSKRSRGSAPTPGAPGAWPPPPPWRGRRCAAAVPSTVLGAVGVGAGDGHLAVPQRRQVDADACPACRRARPARAVAPWPGPGASDSSLPTQSMTTSAPPVSVPDASSERELRRTARTSCGGLQGATSAPSSGPAVAGAGSLAPTSKAPGRASAGPGRRPCTARGCPPRARPPCRRRRPRARGRRARRRRWVRP